MSALFNSDKMKIMLKLFRCATCRCSGLAQFVAVCTMVLLLVYELRKNTIAVPVMPQAVDMELERSNSDDKVLLLYWSRLFDDVPRISTAAGDRFQWPFLYTDQRCPVPCEISANRSRAREASAFIVHSHNVHEMPPERYSTVPWLIHSNESPQNTKALRDEEILSKFSYYIGYRLDSDFPCPEFTKPSLEKPVAFDEKRDVVAIYTHCEVVRTEYIRRLMKHIEVDSYGKCLRNKIMHSSRAARNWSAASLRIQRNYKFSLVVTNADCDYYFTEKIFNALSAGSVPVWLGTGKINEVLWGNLRHSIIKVSDFASPEKLGARLRALSRNESEYNAYLRWKYHGFGFPREYYVSAVGQWWDGVPLYCRVCMKIAAARGEKTVMRRGKLVVDRCDGTQRRTLEKWIRE